MAEKKMLLDLTTDEYVANIKIDDVAYGLLAIDNLSIVERQKIAKLGQLLAGVSKIKTTVDEDKYNKLLLDFMCLIIPKAARSLLAKLAISKKLDAVTAYMNVSGLLKKKVIALRPAAKARAKTKPRVRQTGAK